MSSPTEVELMTFYNTHVTHKNPVYDLPRHESFIPQWLEPPSDILEGYGSYSLRGVQKFIF